MRIVFAALTLAAVGCATKGKQETPAQPARQVSAVSTQNLTLQPTEIQGLVVRADTAATQCEPTGEDRKDPSIKLYTCVTNAYVAFNVNSKEAGIADQFYTGGDEYTMTGVGSRLNIAVPPDEAARQELEAINALGVNGLERRYRHFLEGCHGDQILVTYWKDHVRMEAGEYLSDTRCRLRKTFIKAKAQAVYLYNEGHLQTAQGIKAASQAFSVASQKVAEQIQASRETSAELLRRSRIQVGDKLEKLGGAIRNQDK